MEDDPTNRVEKRTLILMKGKGASGSSKLGKSNKDPEELNAQTTVDDMFSPLVGTGSKFKNAVCYKSYDSDRQPFEKPEPKKMIQTKPEPEPIHPTLTVIIEVAASNHSLVGNDPTVQDMYRYNALHAHSEMSQCSPNPFFPNIIKEQVQK